MAKINASKKIYQSTQKKESNRELQGIPWTKAKRAFALKGKQMPQADWYPAVEMNGFEYSEQLQSLTN